MKHAILLLLVAGMTRQASSQNVGIGTAAPTAMLDVNGSLRIRSGTPAAGKVLTSDANGNANWTPAVQPGVVMTENAADPDLIANGYTNSATVVLATKDAFTTTAPVATWAGATHFLEGRIAPAVIAGSANSYIVFGGYDEQAGNLNDGAIYNAVADTWTAIPAIGDGIDRSGPAIAWTGTKLIVWGGYIYNAGFTYYNTGAVYDPATKVWTQMSTTAAPAGRGSYAQAYNAATNELAIWGGANAAGTPLGDGAKYNVATNTWTAISTVNAPTSRLGMAFANNGGQLFLFGGSTTYSPSTYTAQAYTYTFNTNTWAAVTAPSLSARAYALAGFINGRYIIWSGTSAASSNETTGAVFNTANNTWTAMSTSGVPNPYAGKAAASNNYFAVVGFNGCAKYDPVANTWSSLAMESRANHGLAGNSNSLFTYGGKTSLVAGSPTLLNGSRLFWSAQAITTHMASALELYLYKKN